MQARPPSPGLGSGCLSPPQLASNTGSARLPGTQRPPHFACCSPLKAAVAEAREADTALTAARWEADAAARAAAAQLEESVTEASRLRRQVQALAQQGDSQVKELLSEVASLRQQLA
jgi:hypothetical protein